MSRFFGSEICMLDAKGRINVPAKMRRNLAPEANDTFVIVPSFDPCVNLYPADEFANFEATLAELKQGDPDAREFVRGIYANASEVALDAQGRLNIPENLLSWAGVSKEARLVGNKDRLELWHPKTFEKHTQSLDRAQLDRFAKKFLS